MRDRWLFLSAVCAGGFLVPFAVFRSHGPALTWISDRFCYLEGCPDHPTGFLAALGTAGLFSAAGWIILSSGILTRLGREYAVRMTCLLLTMALIAAMAARLPESGRSDASPTFPQLAPVGTAASISVMWLVVAGCCAPVLADFIAKRPLRSVLTAVGFACLAALAALVAVESSGGYRTAWTVGDTRSFAPQNAGWQRITRDSAAFEVPPDWHVGPQTLPGDIYPLAEHSARCGPIAVGTAFLASATGGAWWGEAVDAAAERTLGAEEGPRDLRALDSAKQHWSARLRVPGCPHELTVYTRPFADAQDTRLWLVVAGTAGGADAPPDRALRRTAFG